MQENGEISKEYKSLINLTRKYIKQERGNCIVKMTMDNRHEPFVMIYTFSSTKIIALRAYEGNSQIEKIELGYLIGFINNTKTGSKVDLVRSSQKLKGIGREMMLFWEEISVNQNKKEIILNCAGGASGGNFSFYSQLGYKNDPSKESRSFWLPMIKHLELENYCKSKAKEKQKNLFDTAPKNVIDYINNANSLFKYEIQQFKQGKKTT